MKSILNKLVFMSLLLTAIFTTTKAGAQVRLNVPFSFNIGGVNYSADTYLIEPDLRPSPSFVALKNKDGLEISRWSLGPGDPALSDLRVSMFFDAVKNVHTLRTIQYHSLITSRLDESTRR